MEKSPAEKRLTMASVMGLITLALLVVWYFAPFPVKLAVIIVGMTTGVYAAYNLVLYRYKSRSAPDQ